MTEFQNELQERQRFGCVGKIVCEPFSIVVPVVKHVIESALQLERVAIASSSSVR
jgi:hypothetical protein